jgi:hypothetical protein
MSRTKKLQIKYSILKQLQKPFLEVFWWLEQWLVRIQAEINNRKAWRKEQAKKKQQAGGTK